MDLQWFDWTDNLESELLVGESPPTGPSSRTFERLPPEITSYIFMHCLLARSSSNIANGLLLLGQVCKYWKEISLTTPEQPKELSRALLYTQTLPQWLSKSGDHPLSISFTLSSPSKLIFAANFVFLNTVLSFSHRCRSLSLQIGSTPRREGIHHTHVYALQQLKSPPHGFPLLENLDLELPFSNHVNFMSTFFAQDTSFAQRQNTGISTQFTNHRGSGCAPGTADRAFL
jgi:hypothetical protein